jgi:hypothetical protein
MMLPGCEISTQALSIKVRGWTKNHWALIGLEAESGRASFAQV